MGCCRGQVGNMWDRSGVKYLTYFWPENGNCIIFDESNAVLDEIYGTVEEALENHEAVLIHSVDGCSRACFCAAVYFILKYRWCVVGDVAAGRWHVCLVCARDAIVAVIVVHNTVSRCADSFRVRLSSHVTTVASFAQSMLSLGKPCSTESCCNGCLWRAIDELDGDVCCCL